MRRRPALYAACLLPVLLPVALAASPASAATSPRPRPSVSTPTLPVPTDVVDPALSVGGPRLASMGVVVDLPAGVSPPPATVRDVAYVVADAETGDILAAKAPHALLRPASTIKALTALTLLPSVPMTATHVATDANARADGTRVGLVPGMRYTGRQLFQALIMASANDAAYALADLAGGWDPTLAKINAKARALGAWDTVVKDPSGLDADGQHSSAYDLALIGRAAARDPRYVALATTRSVTFPLPKRTPSPTPTRTKRTGTAKPTPTPTAYDVQNHNKLLYNYPGTIGVKNGYTTLAHRTFIAAATRGGRTIVVSEMYGLDFGWRPTAALLDWGFANAGKARPVGRLVDPGEVTARPGTATTPPAAASASGTASATGVSASGTETVASSEPVRTLADPAPVAASGDRPWLRTVYGLALWQWAAVALGALTVAAVELRWWRRRGRRH